MRRWIAGAGVVALIACGGKSVDTSGTAGTSGSSGHSGTGGGSGGGSGGSAGSGGGSGGASSGCELAIVQQGALLPAVSVESRFAGPGLVAAGDSFVLGYREQTSNGTFAVNLMQLSDAGLDGMSALPADTCAKPAASDGFGVSFFQGQGLAVASLPDCNNGNGAGAAFVPFAADAVVGSWSTPHNPGFSALSISSGALAPTSVSNEHFFAYVATESGSTTAQLARILGNSFTPGAEIEDLFEGQIDSFVSIASSNEVLAIAGSNGLSLRFQLRSVQPGSTTLLGEVERPGSPWTAVTAWGPRALMLASDVMGPSIVALEATVGGVTELVSGYIAAPPPTSGAVTTLHDDVFVALGMPGSIQVARLPALSATPSVSVDLPAPGFQGTQVAMTASGQRVALAWLNETAPGTSPGGYALLGCAE